MRREERVELIYYLRLHRKGERETLGSLVNVNSDGIMLIGEHPMPKGGRCLLTMDLPQHFDEKRQFEFSGEILWSTTPPGSSFYHSGIRFISISDENRRILERLKRVFQREEIGLNLSDELNPPETTGLH